MCIYVVLHVHITQVYNVLIGCSCIHRNLSVIDILYYLVVSAYFMSSVAIFVNIANGFLSTYFIKKAAKAVVFNIHLNFDFSINH